MGLPCPGGSLYDLEFGELIGDLFVELIFGAAGFGVVGPELLAGEAVDDLDEVLDLTVFVGGEGLLHDEDAGVEGRGVVGLIEEGAVGIVLPLAGLGELGAADSLFEGASGGGVVVVVVWLLAAGEKR